MSKVQRFEDLSIFQMARDLCKDVYAITKDGEFHKDMRFVQQIHAAAGSIMDNIAEGYERDGNKEFINFLYIAKGSCGEVRSQIIRATDVGFIDKDTAKKLYNDSLNLSKAISKFITSLKGSPITGLKHLKPESWNLNLNLLNLVPWTLICDMNCPLSPLVTPASSLKGVYSESEYWVKKIPELLGRFK